MKTLADLKYMVVRILNGDPLVGDEGVYSSDYSAGLLRDSVEVALDAILPYCWKNKTADIEAEATTFTYPEDLYRIDGVYDKTAETVMETFVLTPGTIAATDGGNLWYEANEGTVAFISALGTDGATLYYAAKWTKPVSDADVLEVPEAAIPALVMYCASYCLLPRAVSAASIRQYNTKVDSGNPEDNPLETLSNFFYKRFEIELSRLSIRAKGTH